MSKLANELTLIRHMIEVGYRRKHAKNHIPSLLLGADYMVPSWPG